MPDDLINDPDMTLSALRAWHVIYVETLGRPGWDLSYQQIAEHIGTKRRATAVDAIDLLLRKGWLVRIRQKSAQGDDAPNLFAVCREPNVPWNERQTVPGGTPDRTGGGTPQRTHRETHLPVESAATPPLPAMEGLTDTFTSKTAAPPKAKRQRRPATGIPTGWTADAMPADLFAATRKKHPHIPPADIKYEWGRFINWNEAKGTLWSDWSAAWRNWIDKGARDYAKTADRNDISGYFN
jgi:hypothetical protein